MNATITRMQFLRGDLSGRRAPLRPPWAVDEQLFTDICNNCGLCTEHCETQIIKTGQGGYPVVDFDAGECTFCAECVEHCPTGALDRHQKRPPWRIKAQVDKSLCLAYRGVECRSCYDPCESGAVRLIARVGGVSIPVIDTALCKGCGACHAICPVRSISMQQLIEEAA